MTLGKIILETTCLIYLSVYDLRKHQLPNAVVYGGILLMSAVAFGVNTAYALGSLVTAFLASLFLLLPFFLRAAGAGEVKMLFAAGLIAGPGNTQTLLVLVSMAGPISALVMLFLRKVDTSRMQNYSRCLFDFR